MSRTSRSEKPENIKTEITTLRSVNDESAAIRSLLKPERRSAPKLKRTRPCKRVANKGFKMALTKSGTKGAQ